MQVANTLQRRLCYVACVRPIGRRHQLDERLFPVRRQQADAAECRDPVKAGDEARIDAHLLETLDGERSIRVVADAPEHPHPRRFQPCRPALSALRRRSPSRPGSAADRPRSARQRRGLRYRGTGGALRWIARRRSSLAPLGAGDVADNHRPGQARDRPIGNLSTETENDNPIADLQNLLHVVADEHDRDALSAEASDEIEHVSGLPHAERSGLLVEEHHAPAPTNSASDRDALALPPGEILHALSNGDRSADADLIEDRASAGAHRLLVEPPKAPKWRPRRTDLTVEVEVLHDIAMHDQRQVLVDDLDA